MAKNVYLKSSRVKPFLLHADTLVRRNVAAYFRESLSQDKELIPLVVEACGKYGEAGNPAGLEAARHFRQSYPSVSLVLERLERAEDETIVHAMNNILRAMSAPVFFLCQGRLMRAPQVFPSTRNTLHRRLGIWNRPPGRLVSAFERLIEEARGEDELNSDLTQRTLAGDLVDALVPYEEPSSKFLIERLAHCSGETDRGILFVIDLLGKRRIQSAIPAIIECFRIDSEHFARHAAEALIRIGDEEAIQHLRERMPYEDGCFRNRATRTLTGLKHLESEWLLLDLLEAERDLALKALYGHGLCCHYSIRGEALIRRVISRSAPEDARRLKIGLLVTSIIRGRNLPEAATWREEILDFHRGSEELSFELALEGA
jgi:hypothetical protein